MPFGAPLDPDLILTLGCALFALFVVLPGYLSPYMNGLAISAPMPDKFPFRSFARSLTVAFLALSVVFDLAMTIFLRRPVPQRFPLIADLVAIAILIVLFIPTRKPQDGD